jgi:hypothetical protein
MTNTRQIATDHYPDLRETQLMNQDLRVKDHIDSLLREGDAFRAGREEAERRASSAHSVAAQEGNRPPARVRLGRWLVGVGAAIAGAPDDAQGNPEHAGHAF